MLDWCEIGPTGLISSLYRSLQYGEILHLQANCTNNSDVQRHITYRFPNKELNEERYAEWVRQVKRTQAEWRGPSSSYTYVCSDHFTEECFDTVSQLKQEAGYLNRRKLKKDAIPTIFQRSDNESSMPKKQRTAFEKRQKMDIIRESMNKTPENDDRLECTDIPMAPGFDTDTTPGEDSCTVACQTESVTAKKISKKVQATIKCDKKMATQTEAIQTRSKLVQVGDGAVNELDASFSGQSFVNDNKSIYVPSMESENEAEEEYQNENCKLPFVQPAAEYTSGNILKETKFIVFWSSLQTMLSWIYCPSYNSHEVLTSQCSDGPNMGTLLRVQIFCESCGKSTYWKSQPFINDYPAGNVLLSAAILFSGSIGSKVLLLLKHMGLWTIKKTTFFHHQRELLFPAIKTFWERQQTLIGLLRAQNDRVVLGGDGGADSAAHSAKYGKYTTTELIWNCILDVKVVASSEVGGSYHMELEGLGRSLHFLTEWIKIDVLVTDRH